MPQKSIVKVLSDDVQGMGTYVKVRKLTWKEEKAFAKASKKAQALIAEGKEDALDKSPIEDVIVDHVVAWNWSDVDDNAFPLPKDDRGVLDKLQRDEITFLTQAIFGRRPGMEDEKNSS